MIATVVEDERQLDGSRHLEIVADDMDAALRLVISRDGQLEEAELSLEVAGQYTVIGWELDNDAVLGDGLDLDLQSEAGRAAIRQRDDGDLDLVLALAGGAEDDA